MGEDPDPEEAEILREQEAYIASVIADCPAFEPDPRQACFFKHIDQMRKESDWKDIELIPMSGFRASSVDLGWLKDKALKMVEEKHDDCGPEYICGLIFMMLQRCVQRMKAELTRADYERNTIEVYFITKDDTGSYEYRFAVPLPVEIDDDDATHKNAEM